MISGLTSGLMSRFSKSLIHRSGVMAGKSEPKSTFSRSRLLAYCTSRGGDGVGGEGGGEADGGWGGGRVGARERDDHSRVLGGELGDLDAVRHGLLAGPGCAVDGERDARHVALPVVGGQLGHCVVRDRPDPEVRAHRRAAASDLILVIAHGPVHMGMYVDRGEGGDVHWSSMYGAAVRSRTASGLTPGAHSVSRSWPSATWKTARSVYTRVITRRPVSGNVHSSTIFGRPLRSRCSITTHTSRAPATRSIAPPTPGFLPGTYQLARSPWADTCTAPRTVS